MNYQVGDWAVMEYGGDVWTTKIIEIKGGIVIKPDFHPSIEDEWYHISKIRKATRAEIELPELTA